MAGHMKIKRSNFLVILAVVVAGIVWVRVFWFGEVFHTHKRNEPNRAALLRIRDAIPMGASHAQVLAAYWQHRTDALKISVHTATNWDIEMPMELGANDWDLRIDFQDGKVRALRVRTSDGPPPKDGPQDKSDG
jgi:hypothetical protein